MEYSWWRWRELNPRPKGAPNISTDLVDFYILERTKSDKNSFFPTILILNTNSDKICVAPRFIIFPNIYPGQTNGKVTLNSWS